jgi:RNA polymerase sigma-70 factor, ECF subfamily
MELWLRVLPVHNELPPDCRVRRASPQCAAMPAEEPADDGLEARLPEFLPALRAYIRLNVPQDVRARESCSDLVQSVCRELIQHRREFDYRGPEAFRAWLFQWALHKIQDRAKFHRAEKRAAGREAGADPDHELAALYASVGSPSACAIATENAALLERAFDQLDAEDRQVIGLCRIAGLSRQEAAEVMHKSAGAVRVHLSRALVRLGGELERLGLAR